MSIPDKGFVIRIVRERSETRGSGNGKRYRTVGKYECYFNGERLEDDKLSGATAEPRGPGDNTHTGVSKALRIAAGTYQLGTHSGSRYATFYAGTNKKPAIYVHDTHKRTFILIHPGNGFKASVGCINLTGSLIGPNDDISSTVSRDRVVRFIDAMRNKLGSDFPPSGVKRIQNAWVVIEGEPEE